MSLCATKLKALRKILNRSGKSYRCERNLGKRGRT